MRNVENWGGMQILKGNLHVLRSEDNLEQFLSTIETGIARGNGRNYGDAGLGNNMISYVGNEVVAFDPNTKCIHVQSQITIGGILDYLVTKELTIAVVPGHADVTIGGAIASDIHGKNHPSAGSISSIVKSFTILLASGQVLECSPKMNDDLFWGSFGSMGLTGLILSVQLSCLPIHSSYMLETTNKDRGIKKLISLFDYESEYPYQVAWLDLSNPRNKNIPFIFKSARFSRLDDWAGKSSLRFAVARTSMRLRVPFNPYISFFPPIVARVFNQLYYAKESRSIGRFVNYRKFYFPLDAVKMWNLLYGRAGLQQYQFVVPKDKFNNVYSVLIEEMNKRNLYSTLAVLKLMGKGQFNSPLSFPIPGFTLALDFPRTDQSLQFANDMNSHIIKAGGRVFLAKDGNMSGEDFRNMYPSWNQFKRIKDKYDPNSKWQSLQSLRLKI